MFEASDINYTFNGRLFHSLLLD